MDAQGLRDVLAPIGHAQADTPRTAAKRLDLVRKHAAALGVEVDLQAVWQRGRFPGRPATRRGTFPRCRGRMSLRSTNRSPT